MAPEAHLSPGPPGVGTGAMPSPDAIVGERGRQLFVRRWSPPQATTEGRAPVVLVHGYAEHSGRYDHVGSSFAASGAVTWALDLRGHGRSEGPRANIEHLEWALADLDRLVDRAGAGAIMFGHSLGGTLAAAYAVTRPGTLRALVLSAPAVHLARRPSWQVWPVRALAAVAPAAGVARVLPEGLSRDPKVVESFVHDPLVWHGRAPARTVIEMWRAGRVALGRAGELTLPLLVVQGDADPIVPPSSTRDLFAAAAGPDKELVVLPGFRHEPHQELGREDVIERVVQWTARH